MAHEFKIMDTSRTITTYTDYDDIPLASLLHVIKFAPDIGPPAKEINVSRSIFSYTK